MYKSSNILFLLLLTACVYAQESQTILNCRCLEKINKDYVVDSLITGEKNWTEFQSTEPLRDKVFANLDSDKPIIKSITPPHEYFPEGEVHEFYGTVIHHSEDLIILKWENPFGNKVWIATINLKHKKAIVTESYNGLTSFGMNIEILDCH